MNEAIVIVDDEAARIEAGKYAIGLEVVAQLFGEDARVDEKARSEIITLGDITMRLGLSSLSYVNGA